MHDSSNIGSADVPGPNASASHAREKQAMVGGGRRTCGATGWLSEIALGNRGGPGLFERLTAISSGFKMMVLQAPREQIAVRFIVVHNQNPGRGFFARSGYAVCPCLP